MTRIALLFVGLLAVAQGALAVTIELPEEYPLKGETTAIRVVGEDGPLAGAEIDILYRPNSDTSFAKTLPPTDAAGATEWTPLDAGLVRLSVRAAGSKTVLFQRDVSVRFGSFPGGGIFIMVLAGTLLFGGAALGLVKLLQAGPVEQPPSS